MPRLVQSAVQLTDAFLTLTKAAACFLLFAVLACLCHSIAAHGQGAAVFAPMSKVEFGVTQPISVRIFNRLDKPLKFTVHPICDIDGTQHEGKVCLDYFRLRSGGTEVTDTVRVLANGSFDATIHLKTKVSQYAFFKYRFEPEVAGEEVKSGINFVFEYQPGYLFLASGKYEALAEPKFQTPRTESARIAQFSFETKNMTAPSLVSVSAKITDKTTKALKRFVRLAAEKIVDPSRGDLNLAAEFAMPDDIDPVCFEMFVTHHGPSPSIQKLQGCE